MKTYQASISEVVDRLRDDPDFHDACDTWAKRALLSSNPDAVDTEFLDRIKYLLLWHATNPVEVEADYE
jgi:hypothetical protein